MNYNLVGWLEKNKDPLNDTVVDQFKKGKNELVVELFADHAGQSAPKEEGGGGKGELPTLSRVTNPTPEQWRTQDFLKGGGGSEHSFLYVIGSRVHNTNLT